MEIHGSTAAAVHAQPFATVTVTIPLPPLELSDWLVGDSVAGQLGSGVNTPWTGPHVPVLSRPRMKIRCLAANGPAVAAAISTVLPKFPSAAVIALAVPPLQGG